ncbi:MAG TPA: hypothetical protein VLE27_07565 [Thermoanaerobaculia bacterium]|nr:hypothetical protein [Thermoanaerobaculia bacterium]
MDRRQNSFFFNGINARTGDYLFPPQSAEEILSRLRGMPKSDKRVVMPGIDPKELSQAGWGVIFHERENPEVREALRPLLEHRKAQAARRFQSHYREFYGETGFRDGEAKEDFLVRRGAVLGPVAPSKMPYYLLIVGDPKLIPFHFQHQLDVQYAVGRICFDTPEEYERYAKSVVEAETREASRGRRVSLFGVSNADDYATQLSASHLVKPLAERLGAPAEWQESTDWDWEIQTVMPQDATKERLGRLIGGDETPALLFTASHGMGFPCGDPLQRAHQGALLCQDWPGPKEWRKSVPPDFYFAGEDVSESARVAGMVVFHFACHGAGAPALDEFAISGGASPRQIAPEPFVSRLPQRLLSHPGGGALAVVGHVERAWAHSFLSKTSTSQIGAFESALRLLMDGYPVGYAMEFFNLQYAELAADLTLALQRSGYGEKIPKEIESLWLANNDARNYAVIGDPAVRVAVR